MITLTDALIKACVVALAVYAGRITYLYVQETKQVSYLQGKTEMLEYNLEMGEQYPYTRHKPRAK